MINREQFSFGDVKINKPSFASVYNRLKDVVDISCQFDLIGLIKFTIETEVNGCVISIDTKLRAVYNNIINNFQKIT